VANRTLQSKLLKLKKSRRMHPRPAEIGGRVKVPQAISRSHIPEDAQPLFAYRERAKGVYDPFLNAIFPGVQRTSIERKFALERADEEALVAKLECEDVCDWVTLRRESPKNPVRLTYVFNRRKTMFFFVEAWYIKDESFIRVSKVYNEYAKALFDFRHFNANLISWESILPLTSLELVIPTRAG
jgi:hypothetical protein